MMKHCHNIKMLHSTSCFEAYYKQRNNCLMILFLFNGIPTCDNLIGWLDVNHVNKYIIGDL